MNLENKMIVARKARGRYWWINNYWQSLKTSLSSAKYQIAWVLFPFVWIIYRALRRRSMETRFKVLRAIMNLTYWLWASRRARAERNLALIRPDLDTERIRKGGWRAIETVSRSWAALLGNEYTTLEQVKAKLEVQGIETLLEYYQSAKKIIAVAAHVGPFDEMIGIIPIFGLRVYAPAEPIRPTWFLKLMKRLRLSFGDILFEPVEKGQALSRSAHHLNEGRIILLLIDMLRYDDKGVLCRIGKAQGKFPVGAVKLALEQEATIFPCFPSWGEGGKVRVVIGSPFELIKTGNRNQEIEINTRRLIEEIYAPYIQTNWDSWVRVLWSKFEPVSEIRE